jgi:hypothetical protein
MRYRFAKWGSRFLATRDRGREVREDIEQELAKLSPGDTLVLDFSDIDAITHSFGDETVGKLLLTRSAGDLADRGLVAEALSEDVRETLDVVLDRRKLALVSITSDGSVHVLGESGWLAQTLQAALRLRTFRASELADALGISAQAANNRLKLVVASGAVIRERSVPARGGKEFQYKVTVPEYA